MKLVIQLRYKESEMVCTQYDICSVINFPKFAIYKHQGIW
jgi:hypothetical protein